MISCYMRICCNFGWKGTISFFPPVLSYYLVKASVCGSKVPKVIPFQKIQLACTILGYPTVHLDQGGKNPNSWYFLIYTFSNGCCLRKVVKSISMWIKFHDNGRENSLSCRFVSNKMVVVLKGAVKAQMCRFDSTSLCSFTLTFHGISCRLREKNSFCLCRLIKLFMH